MDFNCKFDAKWRFRKNDWFIDVLFNRKDIVHDIFRLKEYKVEKSVNKIPNIVYEIDKDVKAYRMKLEEECPQFLNKKMYLISKSGDDKIQITLEDEYIIKDLIEKYKVYEFIGWVHYMRNQEIFRQCVIKKQDIINRVYPILNHTIESVIGYKIVKLQEAKNEYEFRKMKSMLEECVNWAWTQIVPYFVKIDTSRVMFSILTAVAQRAASNYKKSVFDKKSYNEKNLSSFSFISDGDSDGVTEEDFLDTVLNDSNSNIIEDTITDNIDCDYILGGDEEIDKIIANVDGGGSTYYQQQCLFSYCYNITHGKIKKVCFDKIYAEFFSDVTDGSISNEIKTNCFPIMIEIQNLISIDRNCIYDKEKNEEMFKLLRTWIKDKAKKKLKQYNINSCNFSDKNIMPIIKREKAMMDFIKEHKSETIEGLVKFRDEALKSIVAKEEENQQEE